MSSHHANVRSLALISEVSFCFFLLFLATIFSTLALHQIFISFVFFLCALFARLEACGVIVPLGIALAVIELKNVSVELLVFRLVVGRASHAFHHCLRSWPTPLVFARDQHAKMMCPARTRIVV